MKLKEHDLQLLRGRLGLAEKVNPDRDVGEELFDLLMEKRTALEREGELGRRRATRIKAHFAEVLRSRWLELLDERLAGNPEVLEDVSYQTNPYDFADELVRKATGRENEGRDAEED